MAWHMSDLKFVQSNSLALLVQRELLGMILSGEISKGGWLSETALAQRFGVSRGPIREAFRSLEESGLLRQEKNRGVFVREISVQEADEIYEISRPLYFYVKSAHASMIPGIREFLAEFTNDRAWVFHPYPQRTFLLEAGWRL